MSFYRTCSKCGRIHKVGEKCPTFKPITYRKTEESKLRSKSAWTNKSIEIREKAKGLCEVCKDKGIYTYKGLEVHHITKLRDDSNGLLDNYNLICLCVEHHKQADNGKLDATYLKKLAKKREES